MAQRLSVVVCCVLSVVSSRIPDDFFDRLLNGYDYAKHPSNFTEKKGPIQLGFHFFIYHLTVVEENEPPIIRFNGFLKLQWIDERIEWKPADYGKLVEVALPSSHRIWTPDVYQVDSFDYNQKSYANARKRTTMRMSEVGQGQKAFITHGFQINGQMECVVLGSFPWERLNCTTYFRSANPHWKEVFKLGSRTIFLQNMYMSDYEEPQINGWKVLSSRITRVEYNIMNTTYGAAFFYGHLSAVHCSLVVQRDDLGLRLLTVLPILLVAVLQSGAWLTVGMKKAFNLSVGISTASCYILTFFMDDILKRIPPYAANDYQNLALSVSWLWCSAALTVGFHLFLLRFPSIVRRFSLAIRRLSKRWHGFVKLESRLLNDKHNCADDLILLILRGCLAFLQLFLLLCLLFF